VLGLVADERRQAQRLDEIALVIVGRGSGGGGEAGLGRGMVAGLDRGPRLSDRGAIGGRHDERLALFLGRSGGGTAGSDRGGEQESRSEAHYKPPHTGSGPEDPLA